MSNTKVGVGPVLHPDSVFSPIVSRIRFFLFGSWTKNRRIHWCRRLFLYGRFVASWGSRPQLLERFEPDHRGHSAATWTSKIWPPDPPCICRSLTRAHYFLSATFT